MNTALIRIPESDSKRIIETISPELYDSKSERTMIKISSDKEGIVLELSAKDINALKVIINHVLRLISCAKETEKINGELNGN